MTKSTHFEKKNYKVRWWRNYKRTKNKKNHKILLGLLYFLFKVAHNTKVSIFYKATSLCEIVFIRQICCTSSYLSSLRHWSSDPQILSSNQLETFKKSYWIKFKVRWMGSKFNALWFFSKVSCHTSYNQLKKRSVHRL